MFNTLFPEVFPSNQQYAAHYGEFLRNGYLPSLGSMSVKFPYRDATRAIKDESVGLVDGMCKLIIMLGIVGAVAELEISKDDLKGTRLGETLKSFASIRCTFTRFDNPGHHFLYSLRYLVTLQSILVGLFVSNLLGLMYFQLLGF